MTSVYDLTKHPEWMRRQHEFKRQEIKPFDVTGYIWRFSQIPSPNGLAFSMLIGKTKDGAEEFISRIHSGDTKRKQKISTDIAQLLHRAHKLQHPVHILAQKEDQEYKIIASKDLTERQILLGPFSSLRNKLNSEQSMNLTSFLKVVSHETKLPLETVKRIWDWPVHNVPEIKTKVHIFQSMFPNQIPTDADSRKGMSFAIVIGSVEENYGKRNAIKQRLSNETWKWNMIGKFQSQETLTLFRQTIHSVLPSLVELAIGAACKFGQDTTLLHQREKIAAVVVPAVILNLCQGSTLEVIGKTKLLQKILKEFSPPLHKDSDLTTIGLKNAVQTDELFFQLQKSVFPNRGPKEGSSLTWLDAHLNLEQSAS